MLDVLLAFSFVNLSVIAHYYVRQHHRALRDCLLFPLLLFPLIGMLSLIWLALGIAYLAKFTGFFRREPPELDFVEAEG